MNLPKLSLIKVIILPALVLSMSCSEASELNRESWLLRTLTQDHLHLIMRDPDLVAGKYAKMSGESLDGSASLYPYFRGTLSQMYRDLSSGESLVIPSIYTSPESAQVFLIGDPHLENVSVSLGEDGLLGLDWDDFDGAGYGPWIWDVRRLVLSLWVAHEELCEQLDLSQPEARIQHLIERLTLGYLQGVDDWRRGLRSNPREGKALPAVIRRLFQTARARSQSEALSRRYILSSESGVSALRRGTIREPNQRGVIKDALLPVTRAEAQMIEEVARSLKERGAQTGELLDYARRYGQGVSSYPLMRFYLLFSGVSDSASDDQLWEMKELGDRPVPSGLELYPPRRFGAQGERVLKARRALQWRPLGSLSSADPTTWVDVGNASFRVRRRSDLQRGLDLEDLTSSLLSTREDRGEDAVYDELSELAEVMGALLASAHCFADTLEGRPGGEVIFADLNAAGRSGLMGELTSFAVHYGPILRSDQRALRALLEEFGPTLGARGGDL